MRVESFGRLVLARPDRLGNQTPKTPGRLGHPRALQKSLTEGPCGWALLAEVTFHAALNILPFQDYH